MSDSKTYHLLFNTVGALLGIFVVGYVIYSFFQSISEPPCSAQYPAPIRFSLKSGDALLTPAQLEARAGPHARGVLENAKVVADGAVPTGEALEITLRDATTGQQNNAKPIAGVEFEWLPPSIAGATSACLSYDVWLPEGFDFADGGLLPGIFGQPAPGSPPGKGGFAALLDWAKSGMGNLHPPSDDPGQHRSSPASGFPLHPGRWIKLEQELVLNTPGTADGRVRLWADGKLVSEQFDRTFRSDANKTGIAGVKAHISYTRAAAKPGTLRLSPFEMAWR
jgi:hypothetical protein